MKTAQLDHVVIGPSGIFIIETKNWSRKFVEAGEFHDPYSQIGRANHLCYQISREADAFLKSRDIIATRTRLPEKPKASFAKILTPEKIVGNILNCDQQYALKAIKRTTNVLSQFINTDGPPPS
ncbi:MAG: nuclease-related domain-containing protein [Sumerlaeia bacterium]